MNEIDALIILTSTPGLGPIKTKLLIQLFGSATNALNATVADVKVCQNLHSDTLDAWGWWKKDTSWKKNIELVNEQKVILIPYTSSSYPKKLLEIIDYPLLLYVKGNLESINMQGIAVVGTRIPTLYGKEMGEKLSQELASKGVNVVSGLARGIDTAAHQGALRSGRTIAVIGSGLANLYPKENSSLAEKIMETGAVISEFPMMTPPDRQNFPQRNRIVSGMTMGTLLIEAPEKSGAMITMDRALQQKRKLFALPGRADNQNYKGNHLLIKEGKAALIETVDDILQSFDKLFTLNNLKQYPQRILPFLDPEEKEFLHKMPEEELNIEELVKITKLPIMKINILLMSLLMKKVIKEYPGKIYKKGLS